MEKVMIQEHTVKNHIEHVLDMVEYHIEDILDMMFRVNNSKSTYKVKTISCICTKWSIVKYQ